MQIHPGMKQPWQFLLVVLLISDDPKESHKCLWVTAQFGNCERSSDSFLFHVAGDRSIEDVNVHCRILWRFHWGWTSFLWLNICNNSNFSIHFLTMMTMFSFWFWVNYLNWWTSSMCCLFPRLVMTEMTRCCHLQSWSWYNHQRSLEAWAVGEPELSSQQESNHHTCYVTQHFEGIQPVFKYCEICSWICYWRALEKTPICQQSLRSQSRMLLDFFLDCWNNPWNRPEIYCKLRN